jgi:signal transduction histidine kinase
MHRVQAVVSQGTSSAHAKFLASISRHLVSLEIEPMLEAVARAALPMFGDACAIDRVSGTSANRFLEIRTSAQPWIEPAKELAFARRAEIKRDGSRSRLTAPIVGTAGRFGAITFVAGAGVRHSPADVALAQELADRLALSIANAEAHEKLRNDLAERERLLSIAAHELRNPICALRLCIEGLLRGKPALPTSSTQVLQRMAREEKRLTRLIDELLDVARIRSGHFRIDLESVDLCEVVRDATSRLAVEIERSGSTIELQGDSTVIGNWDRSRLDQVVTNLLGNAIKFGEGRPIIVRVAGDPERGRARLWVTDHGMGIEPEIQQTIFEPFKRAVGAVRYDGLGLGLYIVRSIITQLGGDIRVLSAPGCGSTFTVELAQEPPLAAAQAD